MFAIMFLRSCLIKEFWKYKTFDCPAASLNDARIVDLKFKRLSISIQRIAFFFKDLILFIINMKLLSYH